MQAADFRSTFERFYALRSPVTDYDGIVGGAQCRTHPRRCDLSRGIVADDVAHTVTFHLVRPDPYFLYKLAFPSAYVLPGGTPWRPAGTHPLPATGPYRIVIRIAGTADEAIRDVVDGKADVVWLSEPWTPSQLSRLEVRYASQMHSSPRPNIQALFLNTRVPPFNRLDARRAIDFAVDRAAATDAWGGPSVAEPTCQKNAVRLTFPKGAQLDDPKRLFNTRLESKTVRAIDFREGEAIDEAALVALVAEAVVLNTSR